MRLTALAVVALATTPALAGTFNPGAVPADAAWVMHLDVEAAVASDLGSFVLENADAFDLAEPLEDFRNETGLDATRELLSLTVFGEGDPEETFVGMLVATADVQPLLDGMTENGVPTIEEDGYHLWHFEQDGRLVYAHATKAPRDRRIITFSVDKSLLVAALRVQEGRGTSLEEAGHADLEPGRGSIMFLCGRGLPWVHAHGEDLPDIVRRTNRAQLELRENDGMATIETRVSAPSIDHANNVSQVCQGAVALVRLIASHDPQMAPIGQLLSAVRFSAERNDVRMRFEAPSEHLMMMIQMAMQQ